MKLMCTWRIAPDHYEAAARQFIATGAPTPPGIETIGRWHAAGSAIGWHLVQTNDLGAVAQLSAEWGKYLEIEVTPVIEDAEAAGALSKVFGS